MTPISTRLLIASHDHATGSFLEENLTADGYHTAGVADVAAARERLGESVDALIAHVGADTLSLLDAIRAGLPGVGPQLPIIVLLAGADELHRTRLLDRGADDVVATPFSYPELRARLGALLRRCAARQMPHVLRAGSLRLDVRSRRAWVGRVEIEQLRGKEFDLLRTLIAEPDRVFTREELLRSVWGHGPDARTRTLDSHASRLRRRLQVGGERFLHNVWGVGYRLIDGELDCA